MPKLQPKEIWKVALPDTQAHEQMGDRPAIVISVHPETGTTMVIPSLKTKIAHAFHTHILSKSQMQTGSFWIQ
jgi:mRNA-degrading endonuclease toxin of MazEF toxin-antitoxin module